MWLSCTSLHKRHVKNETKSTSLSKQNNFHLTVRASSRLMSAKMSSVVVFFSLHVLLASGLKGEFMRLETGRTSSGGNDSTFDRESGHCLMVANNAWLIIPCSAYMMLLCCSVCMHCTVASIKMLGAGMSNWSDAKDGIKCYFYFTVWLYWASSPQTEMISL